MGIRSRCENHCSRGLQSPPFSHRNARVQAGQSSQTEGKSRAALLHSASCFFVAL